MHLISSGLVDRFWHKLLKRPYRLHVVDHGGSGPVIVFLHGLASSSANWADLIPLLTSQYRCISLDLIGFGESPKPQWYQYNMEDHLRSIHYTLNGLQLHQSYTLVGHSLGSLLATRYACMHEGRIERLVLLSPPVYPPLGMIQNRPARQRTSLYLRAYKFIRTHHRANADNIMRLSAILPQMKFLILNQATWLPFIRSLEHCIEQQTLIGDIRRVSMPVEVFYGRFDEVIVPYSVKQLAAVPVVSIHQLPVSHGVGKRYAAAVAKFLLARAGV